MIEVILRILLISSAVLSSSSRLKGGEWSTEEGRLYEMASLSTAQIEYAERILGCSTKCADLCHHVSRGSALVQCYKFCGCQELITEKSSLIPKLATKSYFRDVRIDVELPDPQDVEKQKTEIKIYGPQDTQTGVMPKAGEIEYEEKIKGPNTIKREFEVEIPSNGEDLKWKYEAKTTYGNGFSDSELEWKEPTKQWNGKGHEHEEHEEGYYSSNTTYEIPFEQGYGTVKKGYEWNVDPNNTENGEAEVYWYHDYLSPKESKSEFARFDLRYESNHDDVDTKYTDITHRGENYTEHEHHGKDNHTDHEHHGKDNHTDHEHPGHENHTDHEHHGHENQTEHEYPGKENTTDSNSQKPIQPIPPNSSKFTRYRHEIPYKDNSAEDKGTENDVDIDYHNETEPSKPKPTPEHKPKQWQNGVDYNYTISWKDVKSTSWYTPNFAASLLNSISLHCATKCSEICKSSSNKHSCLLDCAENLCNKKVSQQGTGTFTILIEILLMAAIFTLIMWKLQKRKVEREDTLISPDSRAYYHKL